MSESALQALRVNARPGTLFVAEGSPPPRIRYVEYDEDVLETGEVEDPEELRCYAETARPTWIDVQGFGDEARLRAVAEVFGIHPLALVDVLIDQYYPLLAELAEELDAIEEEIYERASPELVARLHELQRRTTQLLRVHRPQVDALHQIVRLDSPLIPEAVRIYFGDVEDHARQILGSLEAARASATDAMGAILALIGHRQNEVMKVLTLVGAIFIPLTFVVGIYGMNFDYVPELRHRLGYPVVMGVMAALALVMVGWFRVRGWLGGPSNR